MDAENTVAKNLCLDAENATRDKLLDEAHRRVIERLRRQEAQEPMLALATAFSSARTQWNEFRRAECAARSLRLGDGTGAPAEYLSCMIAHADQRLELLNSGTWSR